jgi:hypothetical protein
MYHQVYNVYEEKWSRENPLAGSIQGRVSETPGTNKLAPGTNPEP